MKPTPEQITIANSWLAERIAGHIKHGYFVTMPIPLIAAINNGVDFSDVFAARGLAPNPVEFLPTFFDLNLRVSLPPASHGRTTGCATNEKV